jgi:hypothetical protein
LTEAQIHAIREAVETQQRTAQRFGIAQSTVSSIRRGETWGHLV